MSSRHDYRRRDGRDERDRDRDRERYSRHRDAPRRSRSRSPARRGGERDRRAPGVFSACVYVSAILHANCARARGPADRRDHGRDDGRHERRRDERDRRDYDRGRDARRESAPLERERDRAREAGMRAGEREPDVRTGERDGRHADGRAVPVASESKQAASRSATGGSEEPASVQPRQDSEAGLESGEEGEAMETVNDDDEAMMAMMGLSGFGTTKGKHVEGNQEGNVQVKKMRTWRQYMNRCAYIQLAN
ncbi:uncharacterized protein FIBRA_04501 [Fibroporia radiculosa]|uniref:U4/U6.U5 small nuclear ribonucleoprotein 27kDa protein domain-containing protein n=1 Tax=Fibroporia radiculosa TaxID=599839 RepID=J4G7H4_9APHY|nr:uncharacterized protein FIBRA_04501 [Fibroporia radiculosa]CCM02403.1 predicted protein [Fibroporia radiculosa]